MCHCEAHRPVIQSDFSKKCSINVSSAGAGSNSKRTASNSSSLGTNSGQNLLRYSIRTRLCFVLQKPHRHKCAKVTVGSVISQKHLRCWQCCPFCNSVHLNGVCLIPVSFAASNVSQEYRSQDSSELFQML